MINESIPMFSPSTMPEGSSGRARLVSLGKLRPGNWGPYFPDAVIEVDGKRHGWNLSMRHKRDMDYLGIAEGSEFGYLYDGKCLWIER